MRPELLQKLQMCKQLILYFRRQVLIFRVKFPVKQNFPIHLHIMDRKPYGVKLIIGHLKSTDAWFAPHYCHLFRDDETGRNLPLSVGFNEIVSALPLTLPAQFEGASRTWGFRSGRGKGSMLNRHSRCATVPWRFADPERHRRRILHSGKPEPARSPHPQASARNNRSAAKAFLRGAWP